LPSVTQLPNTKLEGLRPIDLVNHVDTPAREEGKSMAEFRYSRSQAEQFLFAQAWDKYHDRYLTRAYVQEGKEAYDEALRKTK
jgi:hypothetical protein